MNNKKKLVNVDTGTGQHDLFCLLHIHAVEIVLHKALPHCHVLVVYTR